MRDVRLQLSQGAGVMLMGLAGLGLVFTPAVYGQASSKQVPAAPSGQPLATPAPKPLPMAKPEPMAKPAPVSKTGPHQSQPLHQDPKRGQIFGPAQP